MFARRTELGVESRDLEQQRAGAVIPVERKIAVDRAHPADGFSVVETAPAARGAPPAAGCGAERWAAPVSSRTPSANRLCFSITSPPGDILSGGPFRTIIRHPGAAS